MTNAEADLAVDIAGSYEGLLEQQKVYDVSLLCPERELMEETIIKHKMHSISLYKIFNKVVKA